MLKRAPAHFIIPDAKKASTTFPFTVSEQHTQIRFRVRSRGIAQRQLFVSAVTLHHG
jgi:hypothetical protein